MMLQMTQVMQIGKHLGTDWFMNLVLQLVVNVVVVGSMLKSLRRSVDVNSLSGICLTKLDVLDG